MQNTTRPAPDLKAKAREVARLTEQQRESRKARGVCTNCGLRAPASPVVDTCHGCQRAAFGGL